MHVLLLQYLALTVTPRCGKSNTKSEDARNMHSAIYKTDAVILGPPEIGLVGRMCRGISQTEDTMIREKLTEEERSARRRRLKSSPAAKR